MNVNEQKIIRFEAKNFKGVSEIEIIMKDGMNILTGPNRAGKTSTIDAIEVGLGGAKGMKATETIQPIKNGESVSEVFIELTDFIIERRWTEDKSSFFVKSKEGVPYPSPQSMLDAFIGTLLDPSQFYKMKAEDQTKLLMDMLGLEKVLADIQEKRLYVYNKRTLINNKKKELEAKLKGIPEPETNLPTKEINPSTVITKINDANKIISENEQNKIRLQSKKQEKDHVVERIQSNKELIKHYEEEIKKLNDKIELDRKELEVIKTEGKRLEDLVANQFNPDIKIYEAELEEVDMTNRKIRNAINYSTMQNDIGDLAVESDILSNDIVEIDNEKKKILTEAKFPVEGLSFDNGIVTYNGVPFQQCSSEEKLTISSIIAMTDMPNKEKKLKLLLIRDGSPYTDEQFVKLVALAEERNYQCLVERPGNVKEAILIENGKVTK